MPLLEGLHLRLPLLHQRLPQRLSPALHPLAVQPRAPVLIQGRRGLVESLQGRFPGHTTGGPRRQRNLAG